MKHPVRKKIHEHKWKIATLAQTVIIVFLLVFTFYPKPPLIQIQTQVETPIIEIAPSLMEPSFLYFFYNGSTLMGGMWAIFNGTRSIDIRNITTTSLPYSRVWSRPGDNFTLVTVLEFGRRTAVCYPDHEHGTVEMEVTWVFTHDVFLEELIDPYWEYANFLWYDPTQNISFWNPDGTYMMNFSIVPQTQFVEQLQGARLDYIPMLPSHRLSIFYRDNSSAMFTIDDTHGCDFYRAFYNQTWSGTVHFRYSIKVEPW